MLKKWILAVAVCAATSLATTFTQVSQLREQGYDFIVAGGGTAGLTVGDRLSEAFPDRVS